MACWMSLKNNFMFFLFRVLFGAVAVFPCMNSIWNVRYWVLSCNKKQVATCKTDTWTCPKFTLASPRISSVVDGTPQPAWTLLPLYCSWLCLHHNYKPNCEALLQMFFFLCVTDQIMLTSRAKELFYNCNCLKLSYGSLMSYEIILIWFTQARPNLHLLA